MVAPAKGVLPLGVSVSKKLSRFVFCVASNCCTRMFGVCCTPQSVPSTGNMVNPALTLGAV